MIYNFHDVRKEIASRILYHVSLGSLINKYRKEELQTMINDPTWNDRSWTLIRCQFENHGTSIDLDVDSNHEWNDDYLTDEDGNKYEKVKFRFQLNHPAHGATDPNTQWFRATFYQMVASFAVELQAMFSEPVNRLVKTKAQVDAEKAKKEAEELQAMLNALVTKSSKHMRVWTTRTIDVKGVPQGQYLVKALENKEFKVMVLTDNAVSGDLVRVT